MNDAPRSLTELQAWMQQAITCPPGAKSGNNANSVAAPVVPSSKQTSAERLAIYQRAYFARLIECLRSMYPALVYMLGEDAFDSLAQGYLEHHPPHSYTLNRLADRFVPFLEATRPPRELDSTDGYDVVIDLARLEQAIDEVFDGPGSESIPRLDPAALQSVPLDRAGELRLTLAPELRLLEFRYPVSELYTRFRRQQPLAMELSESSPTWLALHRRDYVVQRHSLSRAEHAILTALLRGAALGEAIVAGLEQCDEPPTSFQESLLRWFREWAATGIVFGLRLGE